MTSNDVQEYYADLLILQYRNQPNARAEIKALTKGIIMDLLALQLVTAFDLDVAVGPQLVTLGKYSGAQKYGYVFGATQSSDPVPHTLSDTDFRTFIAIVIQRNRLDGSLSSIDEFLNANFGSAIVAHEYGTMKINYTYTAALGTNLLAEYFILAGMLPRQMGQRRGFTTFNSSRARTFFGVRTYDQKFPYSKGLNTYTSYNTNSPLMKYTDLVNGG